MEKEIRHITVSDLETRMTDDNEQKIVGYINKFDSRSEYMGFYEYVDKNAFTRTLSENSNVMALYNHDSSKILGSTASGSLTLSVDEVGLRFELKPNQNVSYAKDVAELVKSGDLRGASFGFTVNEDQWEEREDGEYHRILKDVSLFEVSLTAFPAYKSSEVYSRSFEDKKNELQEKQEQEKRDAELELKKRQIAIDLELM